MGNKLLRNRTAQQSRIPKPPVKRSIFDAKWSRKQTMNASYITPIMCQKVVPGETLFLNIDTFIRLSTQITCPVDNLQIETFFFYAPERIAWDNHPYFIGAVKDPNAESQPNYITPQIEIPAEKNTAGSLFNFLSGARIGKKVKVSKIPFEIHNRIFNEYFRDPDCTSPKPVDPSDADGNIDNYGLYRIHKSRDYFTNSTRDIQSGDGVNIPLGQSAPVKYNMNFQNSQYFRAPLNNNQIIGGTDDENNNGFTSNSTLNTSIDQFGKTVLNVGNAIVKDGSTPEKSSVGDGNYYWANLDPNGSLYTDLSNATGAQLDALRQAIMINEFKEALNRGGTKYVDVMRNIYDVTIPDLTIQRPVYLGGTSKPFYTNPVVQTSGSQITGSETPQGNIAGYGTGGDSGRIINASFQEFGYVIGYIVIKAQPQYQQGLDRQWTEKDKLEYFNPFFVNASDQPIYKQEIFLEDYDATDTNGNLLNENIFGYIGRYDHLRYKKNQIAGELNSEYEYSLDTWHYAEKFEESPENNEAFMEDKTYDILNRTMAVIWEDEEKTIKAPQFIVDIMFNGADTIPIPTHAEPKISALL